MGILLVVYATGGMKLVSNLVGFLYPAYMSFKALDGGKTVDGNAIQWMTYWIIFCLLNILEDTLPFLLAIKFYFPIKMFCVAWLYHPKSTGAEVLYSSAIRPYISPLLDGAASRTSTLKKSSAANKEE